MSNTNNNYHTSEYIPNPRTDLQYLPVKACQSVAYKENPENKAIVGVMLKVLHHSASESSDKMIKYNGQGAYQQRGNARQRRTGERCYDRMFTFADALEPNTCFTIICETHEETVKLLQRCSKTQEGVGDIFIIIEPDMVEYYLGETSSVPIVECPKDFIPIIDPPVQIIRRSKLEVPDADHTSYFCLHKQSIDCKHSTLEDASCSGRFCDRQQINLGMNQKCGCLYMSGKGADDYVIDMDVTFNVDRTFHGEGKITVSHFRSWKHSNLFVTDPHSTWQKMNRDDDLALIRKTIANITTCVNRNGGWTIIGWIRSGKIRDQSSETIAPDNLTSLQSKPHISYLYPTNPSILKEDQFKELQINKDPVTPATSPNTTTTATDT
jgi:hypothetical protein